ncbi:tandem-95 repeat protein [Sphingomonas parva]|uniref:Tandem-95 repeat protein n=1 Tax=Sphingomonas parva TaxID=2555898 RepID=A0A4Y8ZS21_9SPHN|nr:Ig-like domain-containing protein [Sphingomonas parva]TFI58092.1 tandem-95 repeat protein [Sphingomonas parva]
MKRIKGKEGSDLLIGGEKDERIDGMGGNDLLFGFGGDDDIDGGAGDDTIYGGAGNDLIDGGSGTDMMVLAGRRSDFRIESLSDGRIRITDLRGGWISEGTDIVQNVERFHFLLEGRTYNAGELINRTPTARADAASVSEDGSIQIDVLANDSDPDAGDGKTIVSLGTSGTLGTASIVGGKISYAPGAGFQSLGAGQTATDTLTYTMRDSAGATSTATVTVTITGANDGPAAIADSVVVSEDSGATIDVLANDTDVDAGDSKAIVSVSANPAHGSAAVIDGKVAYTPGAFFQSLAAGQSATETLTYTMRDAAGATSSATVTVTVTGANDAPTAAADDASVSEDGSVTLNLLANDADADAGATLTLDGVDTHGTLGQVKIGVAGQVTYDPGTAFQHLAAGEIATDSFTYSVRDEHGALSQATVTLTITGEDEPAPEGPVANDDALAFVAYQGAVEIDGLLDNDFGEGLQLSGVDDESAAGARLYLGKDGRVIYDPDMLFLELDYGETATDSFTYTITDETGATTTGTAVILVTTPYELIAPIWVAEDMSSDNLVDEILSLAASEFGPGVGIESIDTTGTIGIVDDAMSEGVLIYTASHPWFDPMWGDMPSVHTSFTFTVSDASGGLHQGRVFITISGTNDVPTAIDDTFSVTEGLPSANLYAAMLDNDVDPDSGNWLSVVSIDATGTIGQLSFDAESGSLVYTAADRSAYGPTGTDSFTYTVEDDTGLQSTATVTLDIMPANGLSMVSPGAFGDGDDAIGVLPSGAAEMLNTLMVDFLV